MKQFKLKEDLLTNFNKIYMRTVMAFAHDRFFVCGVVICCLLALSCQKRKELLDQPVYEGPLVSMDSIYTKMSDSAKVTVILKAAQQYNYEGGDREWPKGLYLEYLDDDGEVVSTFRADYVYYTFKDNLYRSEGNVVVKSLDNEDELNTEELFWNPSDEEFYTDRFVTIQSDDEVHTGEGLRADQDFSSYKILKPQGTLLIEE
ncbi:LPS export ABC transporter periplasmic protein LptC [Marinoscillum furvescens]|uniref:LPS export ABC transporter protein LptC n=1 Tax=Marinoscillum furvescens DSM 4134 TaxID=1122208 RepID=A0A3D9L289_MARFU|nr:LPS export ABC transporter periplasmic protein LptC [Marinoscillum furvescens]RED98859.1 LPS export ABC transporter protein LptC [Marinoscillum furvescens DSM 4134]